MKDIFKLIGRKDFREADKFYGKMQDKVIDLKIIRGKLHEWDDEIKDWTPAKLGSKYIDGDFFLKPNDTVKEGVTIYELFTLEEFANGKPFTGFSGKSVYKIIDDNLWYYSRDKKNWIERGVDKGVATFRFRQMSAEELDVFTKEIQENSNIEVEKLNAF